MNILVSSLVTVVQYDVALNEFYERWFVTTRGNFCGVDCAEVESVLANPFAILCFGYYPTAKPE